jgi:flagellar export protein FliJ
MPPRFAFRLQALLDHRKRAEERKQREFASARGAARACAEEIERLGNARQRSAYRLATTARTRTPAELRLRDGYLRALDSAIVAEASRQAALDGVCERARDELLVARRARDVIERLKRRRHAAFELESARRDEQELDEANARRRPNLQPT